MNKSSLSTAHLAIATGIFLAIGAPAVRALEPRTWVVIDGRTIEAELKKVSGAQVTLLDKENRQVNLDKSMLSFGDLDYIKENSPEDKSSGFAAQLNGPPALPNPAKVAKIDPKLFVKAATTFAINAGEPFQILETPHFKIMYNKPVEPGDAAELAERLWHDTAFFHSTFAQKFRQRKMAVFLCPTESSYNYVGEWYADLEMKAGHKDDADKTKVTWPKTSAGMVRLTRDIADANAVIDVAPVFRAFKQTGTTQAKPEMIRGVFDPFRTHCLAEDLLLVQAGGVTEFGAKGFYAITTGHGYYKEILLAGKSETNMMSATVSGSGGHATASTTGGFKDARSWPQELKKEIHEGKIKPNLETLFNQSAESADEKINVLAYSFARYLESTPERLAAFNQLIQRISTSSQVPEPDDFAKIYGLTDGKALEADWLKYINSPDFH